MNDDQQPYITRCGFCEQGMLRFRRCSSCGHVAAVCDECELMWTDIEAVYADASLPASATWPVCPNCESKSDRWLRLDPIEINREGLDPFVAGRS